MLRRSGNSSEHARCASRAVLLLASLVPVSAWGAQAPPAAESSAAVSAPAAAAVKPHPRTRTLLKRQWGVDVRGVRLSAAGRMLEFRYKVLDADKARPLFERRTKPHLVHPASGATLMVPVPAKTGPLRNSDPPVEGRVYWMFFDNPGRLVTAGETVSVVIGAFHADGLVVE